MTFDPVAARHDARELIRTRSFCRSDSWFRPNDRRWCEHVDTELCPGLKEACAKTVAPPDKPLQLPGFPGLEALPWIIAAIGIGFLIYAMIRRFAPGLALPSRKRVDNGADPIAVEYGHAAEQTDAALLLAEAESAIARGDLGPGLALLRLAMLRILNRTAGLYLDRSKTNGDYLRELAGRPERADVARILALVERAQFGGQLPPPSVLTQALAVVKQLGVVAVLLLLGCGPSGRFDRPAGREAVMEFLTSHGVKITARRKPLADLKAGEAAVLLLPDAQLSDQDVKSLQAFADNGDDVVVAGHVKMLEALKVKTTTLAESRRETLEFDAEPALVLAVPGRQRMKLPSGDDSLIGVPAASYAATDESVLLLADDDLFSNIALASHDDPAILLSLVRNYKELQLVDDLTGVSPTLPPSSLRAAKLLPVFGQLVVVLVLFGLMRGTAFGRRREPPVAGRRRFVEHVLACAAIYARGRVGRFALGLYASLALEQLRQRVRPRGAALSELAEALAKRTGRSLGELMGILVEAEEAAKSRPNIHDTVERSDAPLALVRTLAQLLHATLGAR